MPDSYSDLEERKEKGPKKKKKENYWYYSQAASLLNNIFLCDVRIYKFSRLFEQRKFSPAPTELYI